MSYRASERKEFYKSNLPHSNHFDCCGLDSDLTAAVFAIILARLGVVRGESFGWVGQVLLLLRLGRRLSKCFRAVFHHLSHAQPPPSHGCLTKVTPPCQLCLGATAPLPLPPPRPRGEGPSQRGRRGGQRCSQPRTRFFSALFGGPRVRHHLQCTHRRREKSHMQLRQISFSFPS